MTRYNAPKRTVQATRAPSISGASRSSRTRSHSAHTQKTPGRRVSGSLSFRFRQRFPVILAHASNAASSSAFSALIIIVNLLTTRSRWYARSAPRWFPYKHSPPIPAFLGNVSRGVSPPPTTRRKPHPSPVSRAYLVTRERSSTVHVHVHGASGRIRAGAGAVDVDERTDDRRTAPTDEPQRARRPQSHSERPKDKEP